MYTDDEMKALIPTESKVFIAQYDKEYHPYTINLRDYDGTDIEHSIGKQIYGTDITSLMPFYMYRPHNEDKMRYEF